MLSLTRTGFLGLVMGLVVTVSLGLTASPVLAAAKKFKVGIVFDKGGRDDKSFNASAYRGLQEAQSKLGVETKWVEASDDNFFGPMLKQFARRDYDLIIAVGFSQAEALQKVAAEFPKKHFVIIDTTVDAPNVRSLMFAEHEGAFMVGAVAAMASKTGKVGFIGGMDIPLIRRFEWGYRAGAEHVNKNIKVISNFVGVTNDAWNNPPKAKELALTQYGSGVDVIFAAAGASGSGLFDAAEEKKQYAIGVDSNQNWIKPGRVLTSMIKKVDVAVYRTIEDAMTGKFSGGTVVFSLADGGIDYALDENNSKLITSEMKVKLDAIKESILGGKITVPDFYKKDAKP